MAFLKRLGYYLIGVSIGLVLLVLFLKKKAEETGKETILDFCYLPNCRVLKNIQSKPLGYSDAVKMVLDAKGLDSVSLQPIIKEGDINFRKSDTESEPCKTYYVTTEIQEAAAVLSINNCKDEAVIEGITFTED